MPMRRERHVRLRQRLMTLTFLVVLGLGVGAVGSAKLAGAVGQQELANGLAIAASRINLHSAEMALASPSRDELAAVKVPPPVPSVAPPVPSVGDYVVSAHISATIVPGITDIGNHCDNCTTPINLPFAYQFYCQTFTTANVESNGTLQFVSNVSNDNNTCLSTTLYNDTIFPYWDDLMTNGSGRGIFTSVTGSAPNRIFNIEWRACVRNNGACGAPLNFEVRLYEGQNRFDVIYGTLDPATNGGAATVGVQNDTGSQSTQFECNTAGSLRAGLALIFTRSSVPCCSVAPAGMVAWYPLDDTAGTTMTDLTGANNGTYYSNPAINLGQYVLNSRLFNGTNQYGDVPDSPSLNFGTGDFTIDAWIRTTYTGTQVQTFVDKRDASPVGYSMFLHNHHVGLEIADSSGHTNYIMTGPVVNDGNWHFVAGVVRRTGTYQVTLWADGTSQSFTNNPRTGTVTNARALRLARHWFNNAGQHERYFPGSIDEVELFNRALAPTEISSIYLAQNAGKCKIALPNNTPTITNTRTNTPTITKTPTSTLTLTRTNTPTNTPIIASTNTPSRTNTSTITITPTRIITPTRTITPVRTITPTRIVTSTRTITPVRTITPTRIITPTRTITPTRIVTSTRTIIPVRTITAIRTITPTRIITSTRVITPARTNTPARVITPTIALTLTRTLRPTNTPTSTATSSRTATPTITFTATSTSSFTFTPIPTFTLTATATCLPPRTVGGPDNPGSTTSYRHVLDDGSMERAMGHGIVMTESAAIWLNRFSPPPGSFPITLNQIHVYWPDQGSYGGNIIGLPIKLLVYLDNTGGNPADAVKIAEIDGTVDVVHTFQAYPVAITVSSPGDIYIGFENYWANSGSRPQLFPVALDRDTSQHRSWVIANSNGAAPDRNILSNNNRLSTIDEWGFPGNWMIRASGTSSVPNPCNPGTPAPTATSTSTNISTSTKTPMPTNTPCGVSTTGWSDGPHLPINVVRAVGVWFPTNSKFYALGGRTSDSAGGQLLNPREYDPSTNVWITKASTFDNSQVDNMAAAALTGPTGLRIYTVGGSAANETIVTGEVRVYDPVADSISVMSSDPWPPGNNATLPGGFAVFNNKLYILGGHRINVGMINQIWQFEPMAAPGKRWTLRRATLPVPLGYIPAATTANSIYMAGGSTWDGAGLHDSTHAFRYDPSSDTVRAIPNIPRATSQTRAVNQNDRLWVLGGGRDTPNPSNEVNIYDPVTNSWSVGTPLVTARRNFAADARPGVAIYVAGGYTASAPTNRTEIFRRATPCRTPTPRLTVRNVLPLP
jgi:Concanavalin A-like lectin/glucanases superfamily/Kelch motif